MATVQDAGSQGGAKLAFLFDVDNTLLDNDGVKHLLRAEIEGLVGPELARHFWRLYEEVRQLHDYVDLPHTLETFARAYPEAPNFATLANTVLCHDYRSSLYPGALEAIRHLQDFGLVAILSDGDPVFQPAKIARAGLAAAVGDSVLIYAHKEQHLAEVERRLPAERYVLVDDKPRILHEIKQRWGERVTTVHVCQGRYAHAEEHDRYAPADIELQGIGDLVKLSRDDFMGRVDVRG